jgi:hypothetical protein
VYPYEVEIQRTIITTVTVPASSPGAARAEADKESFPLPPQSEWETLKGEKIIVRDTDGEELYVMSEDAA